MSQNHPDSNHKKFNCSVHYLWLALLLFGSVRFSHAEPAVIEFKSTVTPPIWSPTLPDGGMGGAILQLLSTAANIPYKIEYLPIKRFRQSSATYLLGDPDILAVQKNYVVLPIMIFRSAFFFYRPHRQPITVQNLENLKGLTLGVLRGTVEDKSYFTSHGIHIEENDSVESLLKKLKKGRVDLCILVRISGLHAIKKLFPQEQQNFSFIPIPKSDRPVAIIINPDTAEAKTIAARYHKVLHQTLKSNKYREILESYYGKNQVAADWFERMDKFESIYATAAISND